MEGVRAYGRPQTFAKNYSKVRDVVYQLKMKLQAGSLGQFRQGCISSTLAFDFENRFG